MNNSPGFIPQSGGNFCPSWDNLCPSALGGHSKESLGMKEIFLPSEMPPEGFKSSRNHPQDLSNPLGLHTESSELKWH